MKKYSVGVTLIELMVVIAIAAILMAVAAPSFRSTIVRSNLETLQDQFATAVITARTEAANRGEVIELCPLDTSGAADCTVNTEDWSNGWAVVSATGGNLLIYENKIGYPLAITKDGATARAAFGFDARGYMVEAQRLIFGVCEKAVSPEFKRGVAVEPSGRSYFVRAQYGPEDQVDFHEAGANGTADGGTALNVKCIP